MTTKTLLNPQGCNLTLSLSHDCAIGDQNNYATNQVCATVYYYDSAADCADLRNRHEASFSVGGCTSY